MLKTTFKLKDVKADEIELSEERHEIPERYLNNVQECQHQMIKDDSPLKMARSLDTEIALWFNANRW